ncbi:hypothetical protein NC652_032564 [Populus alba x Populus x berolinensis]|nr:hypothetical protein NC652_032564 [Populus alba x Populus x berolinensis]
MHPKGTGESSCSLPSSCFFPLRFMTSSQLKVGPPHFKKRPYFFHLQCLFPSRVLIYFGHSFHVLL